MNAGCPLNRYHVFGHIYVGTKRHRRNVQHQDSSSIFRKDRTIMNQNKWESTKKSKSFSANNINDRVRKRLNRLPQNMKKVM